MKTYIVIHDPSLQINRLTVKHLKEFFHNEWQIVEDATEADFVYVTTVSNEKDAWGIKCTLKNMMSDKKRVITDKCQLHYNLQKMYPLYASKHVPKTKSLGDFEMPVNNKKIYIVRPCGRGFYSGKNIYVIENQIDLDKAKHVFGELRSLKRKDFDVLISEYITNPLLFHGKKFHLRTYLLVSTYPKYNYHIFDMAKIITAKNKYEKKDYKNHNIHDSHMGSTDANYYFPKHYPYGDANYIQMQIIEASTLIANIYEKYASPYPESQHAYEVYGLDFIIDENHNLFLIELNDRVGMTPPDDKYDNEYNNFFYKYMKWTYLNGIKPVFDAIDKKH